MCLWFPSHAAHLDNGRAVWIIQPRPIRHALWWLSSRDDCESTTAPLELPRPPPAAAARRSALRILNVLRVQFLVCGAHKHRKNTAGRSGTLLESALNEAARVKYRSGGEQREVVICYAVCTFCSLWPIMLSKGCRHHRGGKLPLRRMRDKMRRRVTKRRLQRPKLSLCVFLLCVCAVISFSLCCAAQCAAPSGSRRWKHKLPLAVACVCCFPRVLLLDH